jgi:hypothetical protein
LRESREITIGNPRVPRAYWDDCSARACAKSAALGQKAGALAADFAARASQSWQTSSALQNWQVRIAELRSRPKRLCAKASVSNPSLSIISDMFRARRFALSNVDIGSSSAKQTAVSRHMNRFAL